MIIDDDDDDYDNGASTVLNEHAGIQGVCQLVCSVAPPPIALSPPCTPSRLIMACSVAPPLISQSS